MITLSFGSDDSLVCRQTLEIFLDVCMRHYQNLNANRNDKLEAYYKKQFQNAEKELQLSELVRWNNGRIIVIYRKDLLDQMLIEKGKISESEQSLKNIEKLKELEDRLNLLYINSNLAKISPQELIRLKTADQNYLNAAADLNQIKQHQHDAAFQIIQKPDRVTINDQIWMTWILSGGIAGFILSFALAVWIASMNKKLKTPEKTERKTELKVIGVIPNAGELQSRNNRKQFKTGSILYHLFWKLFQTKQKQKILIASIHPGDGKTYICNMMREWLSGKGKKCRIVSPCFYEGVWWLKDQDKTGSGLIPIESDVDGDVIIMKLSPLITGDYPVEYLKQFNTTYLICNANMKWLPSDRKILDYFIGQLNHTPQIILNNVSKHVFNFSWKRTNAKTHFAPAKRSPQRVIRRENNLVANHKQAQQIVKTMPNLGVILDKNRQIVYANNAITSLLGLSNMNKTLGLRPGELVSCIYSDVTLAGCGTSRSCQNCGAVNTILRCIQSHRREDGECRINSFMNGQLTPFHFKITCSPFEVNGNFFVIANLADIKGEKEQRKNMMNTVITDAKQNSDLSALSELIGKVDESGRLDSLLETLEESSVPLTEEMIELQRLKAAENGELKAQIVPTGAFSILDDAARSVRVQTIAQDKKIALAPPFPAVSVMTDGDILKHILCKMLIYAVETTSEKGVVHIGYEIFKQEVTFYVFNEGVIPDRLQSQLFRKEYDTQKGIYSDAYSLKLFGEHYLNGRVGYTSAKNMGTRFFITLPLANN